MEIEKYIAEKKKLIDKALDRYLPLPETRPKVVHRAMRYAVFPGGKRIRPLLMIASVEACGGRASSIMVAACAIELIHTYTIIHDDLPCMDNDDFRRGRLSCHKKFGEDIALLTGDALLTLAFQLLSETNNTDIIKEISKAVGSQGIIGGQVEDILKGDVDLDYIASHKTGSLFEVAVKSVGILKGLGKKKIRCLENFGRYTGLSFQLIDDLMDKDGYAKVYGEEYTRRMVHLLTERAKKNLVIFGKKAKRLCEIADYILQHSIKQ